MPPPRHRERRAAGWRIPARTSFDPSPKIPALYRIGRGPYRHRAFDDVTYGSNGYYRAKPGWDFTTGWGSLNAYELVKLQTVGTDGHLKPWLSK